MRRIFGAAKKDKVAPPTIDETTDKLNTRGDKIDDKIKALDEQLVKFREQLKKVRPGPAQEGIKRRALQVLKQKKLYESQREQLYNQQFNMEQTRFTVDSIRDTVTTVQALQSATKEMRGAIKANKELDIGYIEKLQDDMFDMMDLTADINEAMSRSYAVPDDVDEHDLMAELDALEADMAQEAAQGGPAYLQDLDLPELPSAPAKEADKTQEAQPQALRS